MTAFALSISNVVAGGDNSSRHHIRAPHHLKFPADNKPTLSLTFGSCYGLFDNESSIFETISQNTDVFIWLGDVAYVDAPDYSFKPMEPGYVSQRLRQT